MHEHGLADQVLAALLEQRTRSGAGKVIAATVQVSELSGLKPEALQMSLDHVCEHHGLNSITLTVETPGVIATCSRCQKLTVLDGDMRCPACGSSRFRLCGDETVVITSCTLA